MTIAVIVQPAGLPTDLVFWFWGRPLRVVRTAGCDAAAPVIVEELVDSEFALAGQYALWSLDSVQRVLRRNAGPIGRPAAACKASIGAAITPHPSEPAERTASPSPARAEGAAMRVGAEERP